VVYLYSTIQILALKISAFSAVFQVLPAQMHVQHVTSLPEAFFCFILKLFEFSISTDCDRPHCGSRILVESITWWREVEIHLPWFFISALYGDECLTWRPGRFTPLKDPRLPLSRRLCGPQRGLDVFRKEKSFTRTGFRTPDRPVRREMAELTALFLLVRFVFSMKHNWSQVT